MHYDLFIHFSDGDTTLISSGLSQFDACRAFEALNKKYEEIGANCVCTFAPSKKKTL